MHNNKDIYRLIFIISLLPFLSWGQQQTTSRYEAEFRQRANLLLEYVAFHYPRTKPGYPPGSDGKLSDFGKYHYPMFIAQLSLKDTAALRQQLLTERMRLFSGLPTFHFNLVGFSRLMYLHQQHPAIKENLHSFLQRIWERTDSYNAFTTEGTENHISMSKTSGYLCAQISKEKFPDAFPDEDARLKMMKRWIMNWSKRIFYTGTGEFNSAIYQAYTIIGWLNLYDFATDPQVKSAARAVLDYYAAEMALHYVQAMSGGSDMRGQNCTKSFSGSYAYLAWLWFGDSPAPLHAATLDMNRDRNEAIQSVHAATSTYRPPLATVLLAHQKFSRPASYLGSKPAYLLDKQGYIKQTLYADSCFLLGAGYFPYAGWGSGNNQTVSWKLIARVESGENKSAQFVSGIGVQSPADKRYAGGNKRSPFDQLVHHKNVLIQLTRLPESAGQQKAEMKALFDEWRQRWAKDFSVRFPNDSDKLQHNPIYLNDLNLDVNRSSICFTTAGHWREAFESDMLFVEMEKIFIAIRSVRGDAPAALQMAEGGDMKFTSVEAAVGKVCGFVLEVANRSNYQSFENFQTTIIKTTALNSTLLDTHNTISYRAANGDVIEATYMINGNITEPMFDFGYGVQKPQLILKSPPWRQPEWPSGEGYGRIANWKVNNQPVDLKRYWPVYEGPGIFIGKGRLELNVAGITSYTIDYTKAVPVFNHKK